MYIYICKKKKETVEKRIKLLFFFFKKRSKESGAWNDESFLLKYFFDGEYGMGVRTARVDLFTYFQSGLRGIVEDKRFYIW